MAKPTVSKDGKYRIDLRVTFRATTGDLANALASALRHSDELPKLTVRQIRDMVRDEMYARGVFTEGWADGFGITETNERFAWAEAQVRRAYPELAKAEASLSAPLPTVRPRCDHHHVSAEPAVTTVPACAPGVEYGVFGDEGSLVVYDCAMSAANHAAHFAAEDQDTDTEYVVRQVCSEHPDEAYGACQECNADEPEESHDEPAPCYAGLDVSVMANRQLADPETVAEIYAARCTECKGSGCHWCYWTGQKDS
ncbi:hypothetical protein [Kitasatospora sp. NPDC050543]|uniref:hypothetical protein n=1 Tax=Kitasatospora sp. NPDC050543 TaxID=3364054 RepID=UPI00379E361B